MSSCDSSDQISVGDQSRMYRSTPDFEFKQVTHVYDSNFVNLFSPVDSIKIIVEKSPNEIKRFTRTAHSKTYEWKMHDQVPVQLTLHFIAFEKGVKIDFYNVDHLHWIAIQNKFPVEGSGGFQERHTYYFENDLVQYLFVQSSTAEGLAPYQISLIENRFALDGAAQMVSFLTAALNLLSTMPESI